ncbi:hypothetical protein [Tetragenococcus halophilus]|uniref:hypothetical protein n=1 Tax=Tetragenococcus halophilus TaxID=51669 RepID=UPI00256E91D2|nr:hypothetical protein [Tetragenococcus halophilus]GMG66428.1 hypothetical protein TEHIT2_16190 [Tetragenococcus halophilus]
MEEYIESPRLSYLFGGISILFGIHLIYYPFIFTIDYYRPVEVISNVFSVNWIPWALVIFGIVKIIGRIINNKIMRLIGLISLSIIWIFFAIVFALSYFANPNVNVFLSIGQIVLAYEIAERSKLK